MVQLLLLIPVSPASVFLISAVQSFGAALIVSDCDECGFNDLGKLLFGGLAAAIVIGIAVSLVVRRYKDSHPEDPNFASIRNRDKNR
jgi:hypothetical protein